MIKNENIVDHKENKEEINLNNLFNTIANAKDICNYLDSLKCFFKDYFSLSNSQYDSLNELYNIYFSKQNESIINTKIYKIDYTIKNILKIKLNYMKSILLNAELLDLILNQISELRNILDSLPFVFSNINFIGKNTDETNKITSSLNKSLGDFEMRIVENYIREKYNKNIPGINRKDSMENLISLIEYLENSLLNVTKIRKSQYFSELKEPDDRICNSTNEINKILIMYLSKIKGNNKIFGNDLEKLDDDISSKKYINEPKKNENELILTKNDYIPKDDVGIYKYKLKITKYIKMPLEICDIIERKEMNDKKSIASKFDDKYMFLTEQDIFNIITNLYSYNFSSIDKSQYDLDIEKGKIDAMDLSNKILSYLEGEQNIKLMLEHNYDEIQQTVNDKILNNFENMREFFLVLNNHRGKGKNKFSNELYKLVVFIFQKTLYYLLQTPDLELEDLIIILSQTYFKEENGKKIYICDDIKSHELYKKEEFWEKIIIYKIEEEFNFKKKLLDKVSTIKNGNYKIDETISTKLIPLGSIMIEFNFAKDKTIEIIERIIKKYHCSEKARKQIISFLNKYEVCS